MQKAKISHHSKSNLKSRPIMPRTGAHRTMSGMAKALTAAGYDPSRVEERAAILAKAARAKEAIGKRKRDEDMELDSDGEEQSNLDEMDVDSDEDESPKKVKTNLGTSKRAPKTDRQLAGLKNAEQAEKAIKLRNLGQRERNMHARAGESDRAIKVKMVCELCPIIWFNHLSSTHSQNTYMRVKGKAERQIGGDFIFLEFMYSSASSYGLNAYYPTKTMLNTMVPRWCNYYLANFLEYK
jgi:hypothetical protein